MCACFPQSLDVVAKSSVRSNKERRTPIAIAQMDASAKIEHLFQHVNVGPSRRKVL
jgi:hypothetical protein